MEDLNEIVKICSVTYGPYATHVSCCHPCSVCPLVGTGSSNVEHQNWKEVFSSPRLHFPGFDRWKTEAQGREVTCRRSHIKLGPG